MMGESCMGRTLFAGGVLADGDIRVFVCHRVFRVTGDHGIRGLR